MKIVTVVGARPQFIKAAVVSRAIASHNEKACGAILDETVVHTGQHYDDNMSGVFFREMRIPEPAYHLGVVERLHGRMTARMLSGIEDVLIAEKPNAVLVYGDTNSTLAGALAAAKLHIPIAHVEAGLRSFDMRMPEEVNRTLADRVSTWLFCPTQAAVKNLQREGMAPGAILLTGDVMYDAALFYRGIAQPSAALVALLDSTGDGFCLATVHRAENTDDPHRLKGIFTALERLGRERTVVMPLHPRTRRRLDEQGMELGYVRTIDPVGYLDMLQLLEHCSLVLTDSGGLQKEAFFLHRPCITLREQTEWVELVEGGYNMLAGANADTIEQASGRLSKHRPDWSRPLYGDGRAGEKIVAILSNRS